MVDHLTTPSVETPTPEAGSVQLTAGEATMLAAYRKSVRAQVPPGGYAGPSDRNGASGVAAPAIGGSRDTFQSSAGPGREAYGPAKEAFGPNDPPPVPPIAQSDTAEASIAPWPIVDKWPTIIGAGLSFAYLSATQRTALSGYRQPYVDLMREILERDPHLFAVLKKRVLAVAAARFEVTPAILPEKHPDRQKAIDIAKDIEARVRAIPRLHRAIAVLAWAVYYAVTGLEIHWKWAAADGWNVSSLGFIHSRRLQYPDTGSWDLYIWDQGMVLWNGVQNAPTASATFGLRVADYPHKFIIHAPQISGDYPTREGLGRMVGEWALSKRLGARTALAYLERFIKPWPMASYNTADPNLESDKKGGPRVALKSDLDGANSALQSIGIGALSSYVHSDAIKVELVTPDKQRPKITFDQYNQMCNAEVSKGVLGQTLTTEAGAHGGSGRGLGKVHQEEQRSLFEEDAMETGETLSDQLFRPLVLLNHGSDCAHLVPGCKIHIEESDPASLMDLATKGAKHGIPVDADKIAEEVGLAVVPNTTGKPRRMFPILEVDPGDMDPTMYPAPTEDTLVGAQMAQRAASSTDKWAAARAAKAEGAAKPDTGTPAKSPPKPTTEKKPEV